MANFQYYLQLFIISLISVIVVRAFVGRKQSKARRPPSPPALPFIGHFHLLSPIPHQSFHKLSIRYGPIMQLFLGPVPCIIASTREAAKEFLKTHEATFLNRTSNSAADLLRYGSQGFFFSTYGPYWKFMKKLCMSEVLGGQILDQLRPLRRQETVRFLKRSVKKAKSGEAVDIGGELMTLANNIVSRMIMGQTCAENDDEAEAEAEEVRNIVKDSAELIGKFNLSDYVWFCKNWDLQGFKKRAKEIRDRYDNMMDKVLKNHEDKRRRRKEMGENDQIKDLLDIFLDIHEDESSEINLTMENIKVFIMDLSMGGTHTSALTIEWAMAELISHPQVMEKARQEIDSVLGKNRIVEESDIVNLPYLQAIVKETLRIHPGGPLIQRESSENCTVLGYEIPAKTKLFVNAWAIGRDPNYWEDPLEFRPERFMSKVLDVRGQHFHFIPFGSGRRSCPGTSLALQVVQANLAAMIQCFEWKVDGTVDMQEKPGITLGRAHSLNCVLVPRLNPFPSMSY